MPVINLCVPFCEFLQCKNLVVIATFISPRNLGTEPTTVMWLLPLAAAIAVIYKATKIETITPVNFIKEVVVLFGSIIVFIIIAALVLYGINWLME